MEHPNPLPTLTLCSAEVLNRRFNFEPGSNLILAGTIQFASSIQLAKQQLTADFPSLTIPQSKPLSPGKLAMSLFEVYGMTQVSKTLDTLRLKKPFFSERQHLKDLEHLSSCDCEGPKCLADALSQAHQML